MIAQTEIVAVDDGSSAVSWKAIFAGTTASIAITMVLVAFGVGVGFSVVSPWSGEGLSATSFTISAGIYLIVVAMLSSTIGGYLAGRLRSQWASVHAHERYFRDSAHGFVVWAMATIITAAVLGGATTSLIGAAGSAIGATGSAVGAAVGAGSQNSATAPYLDRLLRPAPAANGAAAAPAASSPAQAAQTATDQATSPVATGQTPPNLQGGQLAAPTQRPNIDRAEIGRIIAKALTGNLPDDDRAYLAQVVAGQTGLTQQQAQQRIDQTITQAKAAADTARKSARNFAFWLTFAMLAGALSAALAAIEGGNLRNSDWYLTDAERARLRNSTAPAE